MKCNCVCPGYVRPLDPGTHTTLQEFDSKILEDDLAKVTDPYLKAIIAFVKNASSEQAWVKIIDNPSMELFLFW